MERYPYRSDGNTHVYPNTREYPYVSNPAFSALWSL
jgi:hypothetical protein